MKKYTPDKNDFFKGIDQIENPDYDVKLPIFYYDSTAMSAIYLASTAKLRKYLPSPEMHPVEMFPGKCLMVFSAFEYRKTDIDPYNEFSVSAVISYGRRAIPGLTSMWYMLRNCFSAYIMHLPVTAERPRRGGVELAGYPKFIADISFTHEKGWSTCTVAENGEHILSLTGKNVKTSRGRRGKYIIHTMKGGIPLKANLYINPLKFCQTIGLGNTRLEIRGTHRICTELKDLELSSMPVIYQYMPSYEAILFNSKNLIDD